MLPVITLAYVNWALILRVMRSSMLGVLQSDYIRTARSKGLSATDVVNRREAECHDFLVITIGGLLFAGLLNGSVIAETVFDFHGMGGGPGRRC